MSWETWDEKGWHEFKPWADKPKPSRCSLCGYPEKVHLSRVDYVTHRLRHGRFKPSIGWNDVTAKTNDYIIQRIMFERLRKR